MPPAISTARPNISGGVFELTPDGNGGWTETVLHVFGGDGDGYYPEAGVVFDAAGNLYGTTSYGGYYDYGTAFEVIAPSGRGLDGDGCMELRRRHGRCLPRGWPDPRCRRQSLWHEPRGRRSS